MTAGPAGKLGHLAGTPGGGGAGGRSAQGVLDLGARGSGPAPRASAVACLRYQGVPYLEWLEV